MTTERHEFWVCTDCYFAHHYGAHSDEREPTDAEFDHYRRSDGNAYHERAIMGLEFFTDDTGLLMVREWFAGESDQRCEGGEPLRLIPDGAAVYDNTCSNHTVEEWDDDADHDEPTTTCEHCGQSDYDDGITDFTWSSCDGCGCHLGGSRYRLAVDIDHQEVTA